MDKPHLVPLGDSAAQFEWPEDPKIDPIGEVHSIANRLRKVPRDGISSIVPAYRSLTVHYDPMIWSWGDLSHWLESFAMDSSQNPPCMGRMIDIPVCYDTELGWDLVEVANYHRVSVEEVIRMHCEPIYTVAMIGFAPGFPYLSGLANAIATPRKSSPRLQVPVGAVAIGGNQTGIYSIASPGGWNILGQTPVVLFQKDRDPPTLLQAGDKVRFRAISLEDFRSWHGAGATK